MRRLLDFLYDASAWLAALAMVGVLLMVLLSIVSRQVGFHVPGTDAYAGYLMAAAGFLALAHTLKRGEHIRVTCCCGASRQARRRALEIVGAVRRPCSLALLSRSTPSAWSGMSRTLQRHLAPATTPRRCGCRRPRMAARHR